ncbi:ankyrin repeat-containing domain protein [Xylaria cubensis]|nr:ankyrin repeat-containing domain protein [Xylaria cubensis]
MVVRVLLERDDVSPDCQDKFGLTPLSIAASQGREAMVRLLLSNNRVDPNSKDLTHGNTPLSVAAMEGHELIVKLLLAKKGISLASRNNDNQIPLWLAASNGHKDIVQLLFERNRDDLNAQDSKYGMTPLSIATMNGHSAIVGLLKTASMSTPGVPGMDGRRCR